MHAEWPQDFLHDYTLVNHGNHPHYVLTDSATERVGGKIRGHVWNKTQFLNRGRKRGTQKGKAKPLGMDEADGAWG